MLVYFLRFFALQRTPKKYGVVPENAPFQKLFQHIILENKRKSDTIPVK
jgi:hypothetical protein